MARVIIVDDDRDVRLSLALFFASAGWSVLQATDGPEALGRLSDAVDLLITDIRMPGMDGWTLAELARAKVPGLPVIYVTGWSGVAERPVPGGVIVGKPYDATEILLLADRLARAVQAA